MEQLLPLYKKVEELIARKKDFAYMCSFADEDRTTGNEELFFNGKSESFGSFEELRNIADEVFPVILGFGMVEDVFPNLKLPDQNWPKGLGITGAERRQQIFTRSKELRENRPAQDNLNENYMNSVARIVERIRNGEALQVVLSMDIPVGELSIPQALEYFMEYDRSSYVFCYRINGYLLMGSSPENLVRFQDNRCFINPIAGTRPLTEIGKDFGVLSRELLADEKELLEHRMLVDLARNDLGKVSVSGTVKVARAHYIKKFASVIHILSDVESELMPGLDAIDLLKAVFPAGTVSGAPKERAIEIISEYETSPRGPYSGSVGLCSTRYLDMALTIRSLYTMNGTIITRAGAGIVKDSVPDRENREVLAKAQTVLGGAGIESLAGQ
ncbi:MAG: anthranilate synthase component I family protein [Leptospirales bacterium]